jgi:hypothetical protein
MPQLKQILTIPLCAIGLGFQTGSMMVRYGPMNHNHANTPLVNEIPPGKGVIYLQIAWGLMFTNSLCSFTFFGHPKHNVTSPVGAKACGSPGPWTAYSWKDDRVPFNPGNYTQYPTTYSPDSPHLPYIKRGPGSPLCLTQNDPRINSADGVFHLDHVYIQQLIEFSQHTFDSFTSWKSLAIRWDVEAVPELSEELSPLHIALQCEFTNVSLLWQAVHNVLQYSYEIAACHTLYYYRMLRVLLGTCHVMHSVDDSMVGAVFEHPLPSAP